MINLADAFDPWGPIGSVLYGLNNSDAVQDVVGASGFRVAWRQMSTAEVYSHATRVRALRRDIDRAYAEASPEHRGLFAQAVVREIMRRENAASLRDQLNQRLNPIGWSVSDEGQLATEDALLTERFFPPNSEYDAYIAIRDILGQAQDDLLVADSYMGPMLFGTLRALQTRPHRVRLLTAAKHLAADFREEARRFGSQFSGTELQVRDVTGFHDRFVVIDGRDAYHVGASLKDAGKRAFMISRIEQADVAQAVVSAVEAAWSIGAPVL
jgi:hypothetical protein